MNATMHERIHRLTIDPNMRVQSAFKVEAVGLQNADMVRADVVGFRDETCETQMLKSGLLDHGKIKCEILGIHAGVLSTIRIQKERYLGTAVFPSDVNQAAITDEFLPLQVAKQNLPRLFLSIRWNDYSVIITLLLLWSERLLLAQHIQLGIPPVHNPDEVLMAHGKETAIPLDHCVHIQAFISGTHHAGSVDNHPRDKRILRITTKAIFAEADRF
jgi:hypothetical protein